MIGLCKMLWVQANREAFPRFKPSLPFDPASRRRAKEEEDLKCSTRFYELLDACPLRMGSR